MGVCIAKKGAGKKGAVKISKGMPLWELVSKYPEAAEVMLQNGMHCIGCHMSAWETLEQGAASHGITGKKLDAILKKMNEAAAKK